AGFAGGSAAASNDAAASEQEIDSKRSTRVESIAGPPSSFGQIDRADKRAYGGRRERLRTRRAAPRYRPLVAARGATSDIFSVYPMYLKGLIPWSFSASLK